MGESSTRAHPQGKRRWVRLFVRLLLAVTALIVAAVAIFLTIVLVPTIRDPSPGFVVRKGQIAESRETATWTIGDDVLTEVTLTSTSGLEVELTVRVPSDATSPRPLIILLAGKGTGRDAVRYTAETRGVVVSRIKPKSIAANAGARNRLMPGDVITRIDWPGRQRMVKSKGEFEELMLQFKAELPRVVRFYFQTKDGNWKVDLTR